MNPIGLVALGIFGGVMLDNPVKRKKIMIAINKITKQAETIVKEVMPDTGGEPIELSSTSETAEYK